MDFIDWNTIRWEEQWTRMRQSDGDVAVAVAQQQYRPGLCDGNAEVQRNWAYWLAMRA